MSSTRNFNIDEANAEIPTSSITRTELINAMEKKDYEPGTANRNLRDLNSVGLIAALNNATKDLVTRSIAAGTGVSISNGDGSSGNPTVSLGSAPNVLKYLFADSVETITVSATPMNPGVTTSILNISSGTSTLAAPSQAGIKLIINTNATAVGITITNYQTPTGKIDYTSSQNLIANAGLLLYGTGASGNWHPIGGYYET